MKQRQHEMEPGAPDGGKQGTSSSSRLPVTVHTTAAAACGAIASEVAELVQAQPAAALGLATGSTMVGVYAALLRVAAERDVSLSQVQTFNLDEYLGLPPESPASFRAFMEAHLFEAAGLSGEQVAFPVSPYADANGSSAPSARAFEAAIEGAGGLELQLLGLGGNGHIAFNEPGSRFDSRTREVELAPRTRADAAASFGSLEAVPRRAVTMGVGTILEAQRIRIVALGEHKAEIVARLVAGAAGDEVPASFLAGHADVQLHVDAAAASRLSAG